MNNDVMTYLLQQVDEEIAALSDAMVVGSAKDFSDYKELCGQVRGLRRAALLISETRQRLVKEADED